MEGKSLGDGFVEVNQDRIRWSSVEESIVDIEIEYRELALHAVCRDTSAYPKPCS